MHQLIIGLGTGRCGTQSLAAVLNHQPQATITHETLPLPWVVDECLFNQWHARLNTNFRVFGDVASYLLPYVDLILRKRPSTKFVIMQRDKQQTVHSFDVKTNGRNHWNNHDGTRWVLNGWDACFPTYEGDNKIQSISRYYDEYYEMCDKIAAPTFWMNVTDLNCETTTMNMLSFCGFETPEYQQIQTNATNACDNNI